MPGSSSPIDWSLDGTSADFSGVTTPGKPKGPGKTIQWYS
jgi:hypothetical protein